jgi:hypothetical protein
MTVAWLDRQILRRILTRSRNQNSQFILPPICQNC